MSRRAHLVRLLSAALLVLVLLPLRPATADVPTQAGDTLRTAWDAAEPALSPSAVASSSFGKLFATRVDGQVYAQPLVVRNTVVAVTERDKAYGLDPVTGAVRWRRDLGQPWSASMLGCGDLAPDVGVTSTPVYDPATDSVVLLAKVVPAGADVQHPQWQAHALDPVTGAERDGYPVTVAGAPSNDPAHPFSPLTASQRVGLLLLDGRVYAGFGAHCDHGPYVGYVVGIGPGVGTGRPGVTGMWASETAAYGEGGIWQSGGGLVSDGPGHILLATGNGISPPPSPGTTPPSTLGESVVRLQVAADGTLAARDFFSPANNGKLDQDDADLGSGAPLALPDGYGTTAVPHLLVQVGKDGRTYLLDRDHLGGMGQGPGGTDAALGVYGPYGPVWGKPAFFGGGGGYVYVPEAYGVLRAFHLSRSASGQPALSVAGTSAGQLHFGSGSPVVTSSGTDPRSALVWEVYLPAGNGVGAQLRAYDALPVAGVLQQRFAYDIGTGAKFSSVAADGGRVYVGTRDGLVWGFGTPTTASLTGAVTDFGQLPVDVTATRDVTLTATRDVTVISVTASAPFSAASGGFALSAGATRTLPVQVTAATPGAASGSLTLGTATGETVVLPLQVIATRPGLVAQPAALDLGEVPVGAAREGGTSLTNTGTAPVTVVASSVDGSPGVRVTGLPPAGTVLSPQESVAVGVHAEPAAAGAVLATLRLSSDAGGGYASIAVPVKATAVAGQARMTLPPALDLGQVPVGLSASGSFDLRNDGNITMRVTKAKPPAGAFTTATPLPEGLVVPPGETVHQEVTFRPASEGPVSESYLITADDGSGAQTVLLRGAGVSDPIAVEYARLGGATLTSLLGNPLTNEYAIAGGLAQRFTNGTIYWSPATGAHAVHGAIAVDHASLGGVSGLLGLPTGDEVPTPDGVGQSMEFQGGTVVWSPPTGAHAVWGAIRADWRATGATAGPLGYPVTDELALPDGVGRVNHFSGAGSVYWSPATGAHAVYGAVRQRWAGTGWELGPLGYPVSDELPVGDSVGRWQAFARGSVSWSPASGAHSVVGAVRARWMQLGAERGALGYPLTEEYEVGSGRESRFQRGRVTWLHATSQTLVQR